MRYQSSPTCSVASIGVCPGSTPKYPSAPGSCTSSTSAVTRARSGVTISSVSFVGNAICSLAACRPQRSGRLHAPAFFDRFLDRSDQIEGLLRQIVVLAVDDFLEALDRVGNLHVLAFDAGELLRHEERLRQEPLQLPGARHRELVLFRELVDAENRDDVLQVLIPLQDLLYRAGDGVMLFAQDAR